MPQAANRELVWRRNRGRNGNDIAGDLLEDQTAESFNVVIGDSSLGRKRNGTAAQSLTGGTGFSGFNHLSRFVAGQDDTAAQLMFVDRSATVKVLRVTAGTAETNLTLVSAILATRPQDASSAVINGKWFLCIRLAANVNRTLVYDPSTSTTIIRYAGIIAPAAPSVANTGAGTYPAVGRFYRIAWRVKSGSVVLRQSLLGTATSFTPSGTGTAARITKPAATSPAEGETHWAIFASTDNVLFYEIVEQAVGTTTYDDSNLTSTYENFTAAPDEGANTPLPAMKYVVSTDSRLVFYGAWEPGAGVAVAGTMVTKDGRVFFTPVLDSSSIQDEERISNSTTFQGWIDIVRNSGSEDRGLMGPLNGQVFPANSKGIAVLTPTGDATVPFRRRILSKTLGLVNNQSWCIGEDENGDLCLYWLDPERGLNRYGRNGIQWCGYDVMDMWDTVNLEATGIVSHVVFEPEDKTVMCWVSFGSNNDPSKILVFRVQEGRPIRDANGATGIRYGWTVWDVTTSSDRCSCIFGKSFGATMARKLKPYVGGSSALTRVNDDSATQLNGVSCQAYITSPAFDELGRFTKLKRLENSKAWVLGQAASVTLTATMNRGYALESRPFTFSLAPAASETQKLALIDGMALTEAYTFQVTLGEASAANNTLWYLHRFITKVEVTDVDAKGA